MKETSPENPDVQMSYRLLRPDGSVAWLEKIAHAFFDEQGRMVRMVGMVRDVTGRKRAEEALSDVTRKLLQAQDQERVRIARELHDDISQRLALLIVELEQLRAHSPELPSEIRHRIENLKNETTGIATDVQTFSHELHSSKLDYLGVVAGMKSWCKEFAARQTMQIDFKDRDVPVDLPSETSFCLFRVLQEALQNTVKHSGVKRVNVALSGTPDEIHLTVSDVGKGFDIEAASQGKGLGLTSMKERVRLVNGTIAIESKLMHGTTIHVCVPLGTKTFSERIAG